jgi:hypothetical protein
MPGRLFANTCFLFLLVSVESCKEEPKLEDATHAREVLEAPFHFLFGIPNYEPYRLRHDADVFSTWGELVLERMPGNRPVNGIIRERILRAAKDVGWKEVQDLPDVAAPDLTRYGIIRSKE